MSFSPTVSNENQERSCELKLNAIKTIRAFAIKLESIP